MSDSDESLNDYKKYTKGTVNTKQLIQLVQARPCLWDRSEESYRDRGAKDRAWREIYKALVPDYDEFNSTKKNQVDYDIQRRWLNLRDCFSRELRLQRETKGSQNRRTYLHFKHLTFLKPTLNARQSNSYLRDESTNHDETRRIYVRETSSNMSNESDNGEETKRLCAPCPSTIYEENPLEQSLLNVLQRKQSDTVSINDEDYNFALSLVPMLQRLGIYEKLDIKMKILNLFKQKFAAQPNSE